MKQTHCRVSTVLVLALTLFLVSGCALRPRVLDEELRAVAYTPLSPQEWTLPNGLTVLFLPNPELPLASGTLYMRGGNLWEPPDRMGTVEAMGRMMRTGGAGPLDADALDFELEKLSASVGSSLNSLA